MRLFAFFIALLSLSLSFAAPSDEVLAVWANEAIVATYHYDYTNFINQQKTIAHYFSADGWINYSKALAESKLPETIAKNAFTVTAVATAPPVITALNNTAWRAVMPLLVVYKNAQFQQQQTLTVTLQFSTAPKGQGVRGFTILSLQSTVTTPPCQCSVMNSAHTTSETKKDAS